MAESRFHTEIAVNICKLNEADSLEELTLLLHRAYKRLAEMGLNYTATYQHVETTRRRVKDGECFLAELDGKVVGTVIVSMGGPEEEVRWYRRPNLAYFSQLAVEPELQAHGIGKLLIETAEQRAKELNATEIALDTAETASHLVNFYSNLGYAIVDEHQWQGKTYRSVIMRKLL